ncbi:Sulfotransferase domain protein [Novipirellula aureliae]|uniref:Sulfotransferase domain protein n=1 Tax=Novipirellula aureliae TaxID=2527966 RepID=A0A5C6DLJ3_9BACT|nr:sulfotransferase [Novipirellula aureliae]TWU37648.1 Sulfotransferase domain protein [Novipirellula aureliae]
MTSKLISSQKIFIVGVGRSGTSLLQSMLAAHSQIGFLPETGFFRRFIASRKGEVVSGESFRSKLLDDKKLQRIESLIEHVNAADSKNPALTFYESLFRAFPGKACVGDKDPKCIEFLPAIGAIWPDAKILHIVRDPRDVLCSKKKAAWSKGRSLFFYLLAGRSQLLLAKKAEACLLESQLFQIHYEHLIDSPEDALKPICDWLGVRFELDMLEFASAAKKLVANDELEWKKETFGPLLKDNANKWMSELTAFEIYATELSIFSAMDSIPYEKSLKSSTLNLWKRSAAKLLALAVCFCAWLYALKREHTNRKLAQRYA